MRRLVTRLAPRLPGVEALRASVQHKEIPVVARSYAPKKLAQTLEPILSQAGADTSQLATTLATTVRAELAAGCRQSLGILIGQDSTETPQAESAT